MAFDSRSLFHASLLLVLTTVALCSRPVQFGLTPYFYDSVCPQALPTIKRVVEAAIQREQRMGASLLRLHFHDCFVNVLQTFSTLIISLSLSLSSEVNVLVLLVRYMSLTLHLYFDDNAGL